MKGLGYLPDPPKLAGEKPDWLSPLSVGGLPQRVSLAHAIWNVLDQGTLGSCVANAGFQAIRMKQLLQRPGFPAALGSRLFGYWCARRLNHMEQIDAGTHIRSFFQALNTLGFPSEALWPYDPSDTGEASDPFRRTPPTAVIQAAYDLRAPTVYRRIPAGEGAPAAVRAALAAGQPVVFGVDVSRSFVRGESSLLSTAIRPPAASEVVGGHAMTVVGYAPNGVFDVLNSWGAYWGNQGRCFFDASYIAVARDLWAVERAPFPGEK